MTIAIAILNWNGKDLLQEFMPLVVKHSPEASVHVIDNGSTDDSLVWMAEHHPEVEIISLEENHGYAGGYNLGIEQIEADLLVLMNNDLRPGPGWMAPLLAAFEHSAQLVAAQPKILDHNKEDSFEYAGAAGGFIDRLGYPFCRGRIFTTLEEDHGQYDQDLPIFWASGACFVVRKDAFIKAGGFDPDLFAHQEEIDLCWRLREDGGLIRCIAASKVYHLGGGTLEQMNSRKTYLNFRNSLLLLVKHLPLIDLLWIVPLRGLLDLLAGLRFLVRGEVRHMFAVMHAWLGFIRRWNTFRKKKTKAGFSGPYWRIPSIVWSYYLLKKRTFNQL